MCLYVLVYKIITIYTLYHALYFINKLIYEIINYKLLIMRGAKNTIIVGPGLRSIKPIIILIQKGLKRPKRRAFVTEGLDSPRKTLG